MPIRPFSAHPLRTKICRHQFKTAVESVEIEGKSTTMPRATVGESLTIDIADFVRRGWWRPNATTGGTSSWTWRGEPAGTISWIITPISLRLLYATTDARGESTTHNEHIDVVRQVDRLGRTRVWLLCPNCGTRVRTIHSPYYRGAARFLCRACHGLAYSSQQEHKSAFSKAMDTLIRIAEGPRRDQTLAQVQRSIYQYERAMTVLQRWIGQEPPSIAPAAVKRPRGRPKVKRAYVRRKRLELTPASSDREAFCVRCRDRRWLKRARAVTLSNGRAALRGRCAVCATRLCRLLPSLRTGQAA